MRRCRQRKWGDGGEKEETLLDYYGLRQGAVLAVRASWSAGAFIGALAAMVKNAARWRRGTQRSLSLGAFLMLHLSLLYRRDRLRRLRAPLQFNCQSR